MMAVGVATPVSPVGQMQLLGFAVELMRHAVNR